MQNYIELSLALFGEHLVPEGVTEVLKVRPTKAWLRGALHTTTTNKRILRESGLWLFKKRFEGSSLVSLVDQFLDMTNFDFRKKMEIGTIEKVRLGSFISIRTQEYGSGICEVFLRSDQLTRLAKIESEISIDVSFDMDG